ncbi:MAG: hypothetical protein WCV62_00645 [Candidatus Peribacteraceae bacterium]|jgi:hypothetical protein
MHTFSLTLDSLSLSLFERGCLREAAEEAYHEAVLLVAAALPIPDTSVFAQAREEILCEALLEVLENGETVEVRQGRAVVDVTVCRCLCSVMEDKLRLLIVGGEVCEQTEAERRGSLPRGFEHPGDEGIPLTMRDLEANPVCGEA